MLSVANPLTPQTEEPSTTRCAQRKLGVASAVPAWSGEHWRPAPRTTALVLQAKKMLGWNVNELHPEKLWLALCFRCCFTGFQNSTMSNKALGTGKPSGQHWGAAMQVVGGERPASALIFWFSAAEGLVTLLLGHHFSLSHSSRFTDVFI